MVPDPISILKDTRLFPGSGRLARTGSWSDDALGKRRSPAAKGKPTMRLMATVVLSMIRFLLNLCFSTLQWKIQMKLKLTSFLERGRTPMTMPVLTSWQCRQRPPPGGHPRATPGNPQTTRLPPRATTGPPAGLSPRPTPQLLSLRPTQFLRLPPFNGSSRPPCQQCSTKAIASNRRDEMQLTVAPLLALDKSGVVCGSSSRIPPCVFLSRPFLWYRP